MKRNNGKINVAWGSGESTLFLDLTEKEPRVLDFEYDGEELHERCGGRTYYKSRSGCSGAGYLERLGELLPVGSYRTDTVYNNCQQFKTVGEVAFGGRWSGKQTVQVAVPYAAHCGAGCVELLEQYPVVIKIGRHSVVYCNFYDNLAEVLRIIFSGEMLPEECQIGGVTYSRRGYSTRKRVFTRLDTWYEVSRKEETSMELEFYNLCSMQRVPDPWEFLRPELEEFRAGWNNGERIYELLGVEKLPDGTFVKKIKLAGEWYRGGILEGNPLETGELTAGWQRLADDVLVRFYDGNNEVHLLAYAPAEQAYGKLARRLARHMGEGEEFISFVSDHEGEYVEFELVTQKIVYLLDQPAQLAELRRGLAQRTRADVKGRVRQWLKDVSDLELLEAAPDDLIITFGDSLAAGNCRPGTEAFVKEYFPGQSETTAGELKRFSDDRYVMRIFRYLAEAGRFAWKKPNAAADADADAVV